jgi:hypothetical protein
MQHRVMHKQITQNHNLSPRLAIILIKIGRGLSLLLSLGGAFFDSTPHQKSPIFRFNETSFDSPRRGCCLRNLWIIKNYFANNKIKGGTQARDCTWNPSGSFYLGLTAGLIIFFLIGIFFLFLNLVKCT